MKVDLPSGGTVGAVVDGGGSTTVILAHGAGTNQHHASIVCIRDALGARGLRVVTFNYPYTEAGRRRPDSASVLLECHRAVADAVGAAHGGDMFLAGRSMGARMATMLVGEGYPVAGVVAFAYPLHPAGKPEKLRVSHLAHVSAPMLFFQGSRDAFSRMDLFDRHVRGLAGVTVVDMEGADHSFRGSRWAPADLYEFLADRTVGWIDSLLEPLEGEES
ncbi:MAG TPA: alpha/beta family hydrolase [Acidimicrobiia bacterium]|nr:alpha/beta family hydrolase [Acidimicrobiia bacterium]